MSTVSQGEDQGQSPEAGARSSVPTGIACLDTNYCYLFFNDVHAKAMRDAWGADVSLGASLLQAFPEETEKLTVQHIFEQALTGQPFLQIREFGDLQRQTWECIYSPMFNSAGEISGVSITSTDISARKRAEDSLKRSEEVERAEKQARLHQREMAHLERLNTMGEMAAGLAHELNQPLSAITTYANAALRMLNSGLKQPENFREALEGCSEQAIRASEIIRHLRQLAKKQTIDRVEVDINELIEGVVQFKKRDADMIDVDLQLRLQKGLPRLMVDDVQIEQVMISLLRNGIEAEQSASGAKRKLTILTSMVDNKLIQIQVSDNGSGMTADILARIFDSFFSTKQEAKQRMGMGLSISRSIIEAHGGQLWAESEPGQGSTFFFNLPITVSRLKRE